MDNKNVIEILTNDKKRYSKKEFQENTDSIGIQAILKNRKEKVEAYQIAINALKKQIPVSPVEIKEKFTTRGDIAYKDGYCPMCDNDVISYNHYCVSCGQALKWD